MVVPIATKTATTAGSQRKPFLGDQATVSCGSPSRWSAAASRPVSRRYKCFSDRLTEIENVEGLLKFCKSYEEYGIHCLPDNSVRIREWAPGAEALFLRGDFSEPFSFRSTAVTSRGLCRSMFSDLEHLLLSRARGSCAAAGPHQLAAVHAVKQSRVYSVSPYVRPRHWLKVGGACFRASPQIQMWPARSRKSYPGGGCEKQN